MRAPKASRGLRKACRRRLSVPRPTVMRSMSPSTAARPDLAEGNRSAKATRASEKPSGRMNGCPTGSAANLVDRARRHPFDGIENADAGEDGVLGIDRISRITGFVEERFDHEIAQPVGRRRATDRSVAFEDKRLAAGAGEQCCCRQPAEAGADHDDVVRRRHLPYPPLFTRCADARSRLVPASLLHQLPGDDPRPQRATLPRRAPQGNSYTYFVE